MKMKYLLAASVAALMVSGTAAKAADIVHYQEPEFKPAFSWTGLYGGGTLGWGWAESKVKVKGSDGKQIAKKKLKPDGVMGGIFAGYNFQFTDAILLGVDTDFNFSDASERKTLGKYTVGVRQRWNGATRLRAGYAFDRFLPYVAVGVSYADIKLRSAGVGSPMAKSKTRAGWNVGAGLDYAMTDHIFLRGEYRFSDFGKKKYAAVDSTRDKVKYTENDIRLGVAYKF